MRLLRPDMPDLTSALVCRALAPLLLLVSIPARQATPFLSLRRAFLDVPANASFVVGDVDGDGGSDVFWPVAGQNRLALNRGGGRFEDVTATHLPVDDSPTSSCGILFDADADGDGDLDLVTDPRLAGVRVYTQLHRQLAAPAVFVLGEEWFQDVWAPGRSAEVFAAVQYATAAAAQPIDLPELGRYRLEPSAVLGLGPTLTIPPGVGVAQAGLLVPLEVRLRGVEVFSQAVFLEPDGAQRLSNLHAARGR